MHLPHPDRVRLWLDTLPTYRQAHGQLVDRHDGVVEHCVQGAAMDVASQCGAPIALCETADGPRYVPHPASPVTEFEALDAWLGFDVVELRIVLETLPEGLDGRIRRQLDTPGAMSDGLQRYANLVDCEGVGYFPHILNDAGVPFTDLADAIRCALGLDLHRVSGTPEADEFYQLVARAVWAQDRAEELDRDSGTTIASQALSKALSALCGDPDGLDEDGAYALGPDRYRDHVLLVETAVDDAADEIAGLYPHPTSAWGQDWQSHALLGVS